LVEPGKGIGCGAVDGKENPMRSGKPVEMPGRQLKRLQKLHTHHGFLAPHHAARMTRMVTIEDKVEGPGDRTVNLYLGPCFRKITNDALNGTPSGPNKLGTF